MRNKWIAVLLAALMLVLVTGCGTTGATDDDQPVKVAGLMDGPISDMGWNASAYSGLQKIEALGAEISFVESVPVSDHEETLINYAESGFQLIIANSDSFQDAVMRVSPSYPDVQFIIINGRETTANVRSFQIADEEQGFMMGAIAALTTETGTVGFVGGMEIPPIMNGEIGFHEGVKYVNSGLKVLSTLTGNFHDAAQAKGVADAMVDNGADVLAPMADVASLGVMEAAEERGIYAVAPGLGQEESAPNATLITVIKDTSVAFEVAYKLFLDGALEEKTYSMGAADGIISLSGWYPGAGDKVSDEVKDQVQAIYDDLAAGTIKVDKSMS